MCQLSSPEGLSAVSAKTESLRSRDGIVSALSGVPQEVAYSCIELLPFLAAAWLNLFPFLKNKNW